MGWIKRLWRKWFRKKGETQHPDFEVLDSTFSLKNERLDWGIKKLDIPKIWEHSRGKGVKVAVLDTGADLDHVDLSDGIVDYADFSGGGNPQDYSGHGTHVAGIIGARAQGFGVAGVAPECELYIAKVLGDNGSGSMYMITRAIDWAIQKKVDVISMSLGSQAPDRGVHNAIKRAYNAGIVVVCASGNDGVDKINEVDWPARYDECIAVGAIRPDMRLAAFTSIGPSVDILAPGANVYSTYLNNAYASLSGTCLASNTEVMFNPQIKRIEDVSGGEKAISLDASGSLVKNDVIRRFPNKWKVCNLLITSTTKIKASKDHRFLKYFPDEDRLKWVPLGSIGAGDDILGIRKNMWEDPLYREKQKSNPMLYRDNKKENNPFSGKKHTKETKEKLSKALKGKKPWYLGLTKDDPRVAKSVASMNKLNKSRSKEHQEKIDGSRKVTINTPEFIKKSSEQKKKWWREASVEDRNKCLGFRIAGTPNFVENRVKLVLEKRWPSEWGFETLPLDGALPDFVNVKRKLIVEVFGNKWHEPEEEPVRIERFKKVGYRCLILWGKALRGMNAEEILKKVELFVAGVDGEFELQKVISNKEGSVAEPVYDIEIKNTHNFVANGLVVHNSMATPFVSGVVALMIGRYKRDKKPYTPASIRTDLMTNSSKKFDFNQGFAIVDPTAYFKK